MRAVIVKIDAPRCDEIAGMSEAVGQVLVQALISHPPIEALHKAVLHWLAGGDVMPFNLAIFLPLQDRIRCQLGSIFADHHTRITTHLSDLIQFARNPIS